MLSPLRVAARCAPEQQGPRRSGIPACGAELERAVVGFEDARGGGVRDRAPRAPRLRPAGGALPGAHGPGIPAPRARRSRGRAGLRRPRGRDRDPPRPAATARPLGGCKPSCASSRSWAPGWTLCSRRRTCRKSVRIANGRGISGGVMAEYALGWMLHFARRVPRNAAQQASREWRMYAPSSLEGSTCGFWAWAPSGRRSPAAPGPSVCASSAPSARPARTSGPTKYSAPTAPNAYCPSPTTWW